MKSNFVDKNDLKNFDGGDSKVGQTMSLIIKKYDIGQDKFSRPFISIMEGGRNRETFLSGTNPFKQRVRKLVMQELGLPLNKNEMDNIALMLDGIAGMADGPLPTYLRVAYTEDKLGRIIDVGDKENTRIKLDAGRSEVIKSGLDTIFPRSSDCEALPDLVDNGNWKLLIPHLNMADEQKMIFIGWLLHTLTLVREEQTDYPILVVYGGQGCGKTTLCKTIIRTFLDPRSAKVKTFPSDKTDLAIACQNQFVCIYDNMRKISPDWSDYLCILSTQGVEAKRKLYSDGDEVLTELHGSLVLNGIHDFCNEPDFASRAIYITMDQLTAEQRVNSQDVAAKLQRDMSSIYTGLLELTAKILQELPNVKIKKAGRLEAFSRFLAAFEIVAGLDDGYLQGLYLANQKDSALQSLMVNPLAKALIMLAKRIGIEGKVYTSTELLSALNVISGVQSRKGDFPENPIQLGLRVNGLMSALGMVGIEISRVNPKNKIRIALSSSDDIAA